VAVSEGVASTVLAGKERGSDGHTVTRWRGGVTEPGGLESRHPEERSDEGSPKGASADRFTTLYRRPRYVPGARADTLALSAVKGREPPPAPLSPVPGAAIRRPPVQLGHLL